MSQYLSEAFRKLDLLNEDTFSISDSGLKDFIEFNDADEIDDEITVIDPEAETLEDVQDSYVGKIILDCCVCHSKLYKDIEDVVIEDDIANANEECPFCYTTDGYKVIGQVSSFDEEEEEESEEEPKEVEDTDIEEKEETEEKDDKIEEGLFGIKTKKEKEVDKRNAEMRARLQKETDKKIAKQQADWEEEQRQSNARSKEVQRQLDRYDAAKRNKSSGSSPSNTAYRGVHYSGGDYYSEDLKESKSISEDINNLSLDTDDTHMEMSSDDNGKVTITTEPLETSIATEETVQPLEPETQEEISDNVADGEEIEIDVDEFDEESFDTLGEGYLKKVYENVNSFKTSRVLFLNNKLIVEGIINFTSGNAKKTNFIFESREATKKGKIRFIGENKEIARGKKSFTITGRIDNKKFLSESFNYNYGVKTPQGKVKRLYGTIK